MTRLSQSEQRGEQSGSEQLECGAPAPLRSDMVVPALAALVVRQARTALFERRIIAGVSRGPGSPVGLTTEDRRTMALVSRVCLCAGLPDHGAEIHELLALCAQPLGEWLAVSQVTEAGLQNTILLLEDDGLPSVEAEELAHGFGSMTAGLEEQLFQRLHELLKKYPAERADAYYTAVREFVVRHPISSLPSFHALSGILPAQLMMQMQTTFYEPVPDAWESGKGVPICAACGNALRAGKAGLVCRTRACAASHRAEVAQHVRASDAFRAVRALKQYWIEPGLDEVRLFDRIKAMGLAPSLYPNRDEVDIAVGDIGIDLKAYTSPEILGRRFNQSIGELAKYRRKWVVIPDSYVEITPNYLGRLASAAQRPEIEWISVSQAVTRLKKVANA